MAAATAGWSASKQVLIVSSYSAGYPWSLDVVNGIHAVLREQELDFITTVEFLNSRREEKWEERFRARLRELRGEKRFEYLVLLDDEAVDLWCAEERLFGAMPTVIGGIGQAPSCWGQGRDATGLLEKFDVGSLLQVGFAVRPNPKRIVLLWDESPTAVFARDEALAKLNAAMRGRVELWQAEKMTLEEAEARLASLEAESLVLLAGFIRDRERNYLPPRASNGRLGRASAAPVVALANDAVPGILAGSQNMGFAYGQMLGRLTARLLRGEAAKKIPLGEQEQFGPEVEASELERWKIDAARIPVNASLLHAPRNFLREYRGWIVGGGAFVAVQMGLLLVLVLNIARRREAQRELNRTNEKLAAQNEAYRAALLTAKEAAAAKDRFLANISHELRTPLNGVLGLSEILLAGEMKGEDRGYVEAMRSSGRHLLVLLNDLLDLSRLTMGQVVIAEKPLAPRELLREVAELLPSRREGVEMRVRVEPGVPEWVLGDAVRLRQIVFNLVGNAQKFTERGWIELAARYEEGWLEIAVRDTGVGIAAEKLERVFERFAQGDESSTRRFGGLGLGLSIGRELAQQMKGSLSVESRVGEGSVFRLRVPAAACEAPEEAAARTVRRLRGRVLVAEDNAVNRLIAQKIVEQLGLGVSVATNGREAVAACEAEEFDLVLMDLQMPEMDGFEATAELRARGRKLPIVAVTASAMAGEREKCLAGGMDDYLSKPIDRQALETVLEKWMGGKG